MKQHDPTPPAGPPAPDDAAFAASLQALLRKGENELDFTTAARLSAARARAVAQAGTARARWSWLTAVPTACALALAVWLTLPGMLGSRAAHRPQSGAAPIEVLEQLGADETPVVDEELDFAQWLDQQPAAAPAAADST